MCGVTREWLRGITDKANPRRSLFFLSFELSGNRIIPPALPIRVPVLRQTAGVVGRPRGRKPTPTTADPSKITSIRRQEDQLPTVVFDIGRSLARPAPSASAPARARVP